MQDWLDKIKLLYRDLSYFGQEYFVIKIDNFKNSLFWLRFRRVIVALLTVGLIGILISILIPIAYKTDWTGFGKIPLSMGEIQPARTLWDWMDLILIPLVLAVTVYFLNRSSRISELKIENERQREEALREYLNKMAELFIGFDLDGRSNSEGFDELIRAHTIAVLMRLDGNRKSILLQFLYETGFLCGEKPILNMRRADLTGVIIEASTMHQINLYGANIDKAKLQRSNFNGSFLSSTSMRRSDLRSSIFSKSILEYVLFDESDLFMANLSNARLGKAQFRKANLAFANLENAFIPRACFKGAKLRKANLRGATLEGCDFCNANMTNADLRNSNLTGTNLSGARLSGADLTDANLTNAIVKRKQLRSAKSTKGAKLEGIKDRLGSPQMNIFRKEK